jgi:hypothetical protein
MNIMGRGNDGELDRLLNAPTNEAWIDPWVAALRGLGVEFRVGNTVEAIDVDGGRLASARVRDAAGRTGTVDADWFVCAMLVERAVQLWSPEVLALDPGLQRMKHLVVDWMNGLQFYLRRNASITAGHVAYLDSPWALTSISQAQFWVEPELHPRLRRWDGTGLPVGRHLRLGHPGCRARQAGQGVHRAGDRPGGMDAAQGGLERHRAGRAR